MPILETATTANLAHTDRPESPDAELFDGTLIWEQEPEYEEARVGRVFNARKPDRFPAAVLFAESIEDVLAAMKLAEKHSLTVSVRSGGHSWDGWSVRNGSLLIDLGRMREMQYDPESNIATVSPAISGGELNPYLHEFGVFFPGGHCPDSNIAVVSPAISGGELNPYLHEFGVFFPGGHCPDVGLGGFLLQGGMGWNTRGWGWACERITAMDLVLPDGRLLHASTEENADLFWAARGSGPGFFAVVVRFFLSPRPQPKALTHTTFVYPMEVYDEVMPWLQNLHGSLDPSIELVAIGLQVPLPYSSEATHQHSLVIHALSFADTAEQASAALAPMAACPAQDRALVREICAPTTLQDEYEEQRRQNPGGGRYAADNAYLSGPAEQVTPALRASFTTLPTTRTFALWYSMAPLTQLSDMALSVQSEVYFALYTIWDTPEDDTRCRGWLADRMREVEPISDGYYLGDSDIPTRSAKFMGDDQYRRLEQLRRTYDPDGRMCSYRQHPLHALNENPWQKRDPAA